MEAMLSLLTSCSLNAQLAMPSGPAALAEPTAPESVFSKVCQSKHCTVHTTPKSRAGQDGVLEEHPAGISSAAVDTLHTGKRTRSVPLHPVCDS